ncbi:MAG TPA: hypothetical protein VHX20_06665 [Terracidiphilus sp.]|jgi:hypothetical protein|nr:hypothetical protein [Terracidiphilus sp.]
MSPADRATSGLEADPRWQLVQRVAASSGFVRSARLSEFLLFVTRSMIEGQAAKLNEQEIGVRVFGRSSGYLQSEDNIVRANASRLRQRLEEYFATDGQSEPIRISLPRGGYVPEFSAIPAQPAAPDRPAQRPAEKTPASSRGISGHGARPRNARSMLPIVLAVAALLVICGAVFLLHRSEVRAASSAGAQSAFSPSADLWATVFDRSSPTLVVPADSSLMLYESLADRDVSLAQYINGDYRAMPDDGTDNLKMPKALAQRRLTSMADLEFTALVAAKAAQSNGKVVIRYARDLETDDLRRSNAVLLGGRYVNPWVSLFDDERKFSLIRESGTGVLYVENRAPAAGEFDRIPFHPGEPQHLAYALVAYVPNLREGTHVLILEGTSIAGTEAAVDFIFDAPTLDALLTPHMKSLKSIPCFEFVLESNDYSGTATKAKVIASRFW